MFVCPSDHIFKDHFSKFIPRQCKTKLLISNPLHVMNISNPETDISISIANLRRYVGPKTRHWVRTEKNDTLCSTESTVSLVDIWGV